MCIIFLPKKSRSYFRDGGHPSNKLLWISVKGVCVSVQVDNDSDNVYPSFQLSQGVESVESKNDDMRRTLEKIVGINWL